MIGLVYRKHTQTGIFVWVDCQVDSGQLALTAFEAGWLVAPGQLFNPEGRPSTHIRLNVATTSQAFLQW